MATPTQPTYLYPIKSLRELHPHLPPVLDGFDLDRSIPAGSPISPVNLRYAKEVVLILELSMCKPPAYPLSTGCTLTTAPTTALRNNPLITYEVADNAAFRVAAIEAARVPPLPSSHVRPS